MIAVALAPFAFSTILGWALYGSRCCEFIFGHKAIKPYQILYVIVIVVGATVDLELVWDIADTLNGLMALPNLIALALLSGGGGEVHQGVFRQGNLPRGNRVTAQVSEKKESRITDEKGRHDRGSCLPFGGAVKINIWD